MHYKKKPFQTIFIFSCLSNPLGMTLTDSADQFQTYQKAFVFKWLIHFHSFHILPPHTYFSFYFYTFCLCYMCTVQCTRDDLRGCYKSTPHTVYSLHIIHEKGKEMWGCKYFITKSSDKQLTRNICIVEIFPTFPLSGKTPKN